jgi:hypothetical protein
MSTQLASPAPAADKAPPVVIGTSDLPLIVLVSLGIALKMSAVPGILFGGLVGWIGWGTFLWGAAIGWGVLALPLLAALIPTALYPVPEKKLLYNNTYGTGVGGTDK